MRASECECGKWQEASGMWQVGSWFLHCFAQIWLIRDRRCDLSTRRETPCQEVIDTFAQSAQFVCDAVAGKLQVRSPTAVPRAWKSNLILLWYTCASKCSRMWECEGVSSSPVSLASTTPGGTWLYIPTYSRLNGDGVRRLPCAPYFFLYVQQNNKWKYSCLVLAHNCARFDFDGMRSARVGPALFMELTLWAKHLPRNQRWQLLQLKRVQRAAYRTSAEIPGVW